MKKWRVILVALIAGGCAHGRALPAGSERPSVDSLRIELHRLEEALRARDDTIRALRLELQRLKEIDLKPRRPHGSNGTGVGDR